MKQVLIRTGKAHTVETPAPNVGERCLLVRTEASCISVGTEMAGVRMSALPLYRRALKQPENVKRVLAMAREQGIRGTLSRVKGKLESGTPTGYSAAGRVIAVGPGVSGFEIGDLVACAGAGIANHAEYIDVPVNLAARVPAGLDAGRASTVTLGAIALQGVRRTAPTLGETVVVVGLGVLGQLVAQMLAANGCRVIGVDVDANRIALAEANGMHVGIDSTEDSYVDRVTMHTDGFGADAVVVTAASASHDLINEAMRAARKKARVVLVGDVGLNLNRGDLYPKELDFLVSTSYGPGRYDPRYEEEGQDYPLPYVRWTENRNMAAYLDLVAQGQVRLDNLITARYPIDDAEAAYASLDAPGQKPMMVLLQYPADDGKPSRRIELKSSRRTSHGALRVGLIGASSFAQGMHLPNLQRLSSAFQLHAVMSRTGSNARAVAEQYGARYCTTVLEEVLADDEIDLVMITSRHHLHGATVLQALRAGKHVFVEKPLTLDSEDLRAIESFYAEHADGPLLMVGYNRRFAPGVRRCMEVLRERTTPLIVNYRMNAGFLPGDHWVHGPEGGGRNLGEACHVYDLFGALVGELPVRSVHAIGVPPANARWRRNDNFVATLGYEDGSICTLTYTALGDKAHSKERMDIYADGRVLSLDDYKSLEVVGGRVKGWSAPAAQKGQFEELQALADGLRSQPVRWPIPLHSMLDTSRVAFDVERQILG
jgi:predicted dehydrogenase/threonine dehydrogenase-like Zn-dependent dehydrogenase